MRYSAHIVNGVNPLAFRAVLNSAYAFNGYNHLPGAGDYIEEGIKSSSRPLRGAGKASEFSFFRKPFEIHGKADSHLRKDVVVLIPAQNGYYVLTHSASETAPNETLPVFEAVLNSFRPNE